MLIKVMSKDLWLFKICIVHSSKMLWCQQEILPKGLLLFLFLTQTKKEALFIA